MLFFDILSNVTHIRILIAHCWLEKRKEHKIRFESKNKITKSCELTQTHTPSICWLNIECNISSVNRPYKGKDKPIQTNSNQDNA